VDARISAKHCAHIRKQKLRFFVNNAATSGVRVRSGALRAQCFSRETPGKSPANPGAIPAQSPAVIPALSPVGLAPGHSLGMPPGQSMGPSRQAPAGCARSQR
jgi:hypothetical protein